MTPLKRPNRKTSQGGRSSSGSAHTASITPARIAATQIVTDLRGGALLDAAFERRIGPLDARDRRWVQELVWGMLRRRSWIDAVLEERLKGGNSRLDIDLLDLLRLGVYQLIAMNSVPAYAAIAQTVELAKQRHGIGAGGLANAVLRRVERERKSLTPPIPEDPIDAMAQEYSHPSWLVARWLERWSSDEVGQLLTGNNAEAPIIARPWKVSREELAEMLAGAGVETQDVPFVPDSLRLQQGVSLVELGAFKSGALFVQDPGATLVTQYAAVPTGATVADLCAAPGGKSLELSRRASRVIAADINASRVQRMLLGFGRLDVDNIEMIVADARVPAVSPVDVVLIDVPCTGTGTFRRHPDARWRLRISDLAVMSDLQATIFEAAATCVKPGGLLVYSTCSLEPEENDEQVDRFLERHPDFVLEAPPSDSVDAAVLDNGRLRVLPQRHGSDGAFAARLRRITR